MTTSGDKSYCWIYENGQAVRTEIKTGLSDDRWIEVEAPCVGLAGSNRG